MSTRKIHYALVALILLLIVGTGFAVYVGNNMLKKSSDSLVELKLEKNITDEQNKALLKANKDIDKYSELESISKKIVPQDKDQAKSVREIVQIAELNGISISGITFPNSNLGTEVPKSTKTDAQSSAAKTPATPFSQVEPVEGLKGVYKLELTVQSDSSRPVSYDSLINFLSALENNRRTAQVSSINIAPDSDSPDTLTFTITINVFIKQ